jgi:hypothetical protein
MASDPMITFPLIFIAAERGLSFLMNLSRNEPPSAEAIARAVAHELRGFQPPTAYEIACAVAEHVPREIANEIQGILPK